MYSESGLSGFATVVGFFFVVIMIWGVGPLLEKPVAPPREVIESTPQSTPSVPLISNLIGDETETYVFALRETDLYENPDVNSTWFCVVREGEEILLHSIVGKWADVSLYKFPFDCHGWVKVKDLSDY